VRAVSHLVDGAEKGRAYREYIVPASGAAESAGFEAAPACGEDARIRKQKQRIGHSGSFGCEAALPAPAIRMSAQEDVTRGDLAHRLGGALQPRDRGRPHLERASGRRCCRWAGRSAERKTPPRQMSRPPRAQRRFTIRSCPCVITMPLPRAAAGSCSHPRTKSVQSVSYAISPLPQTVCRPTPVQRAISRYDRNSLMSPLIFGNARESTQGMSLPGAAAGALCGEKAPTSQRVIDTRLARSPRP